MVNMRYAFQDDENCFFVLDLMLGGDLRCMCLSLPMKYKSAHVGPSSSGAVGFITGRRCANLRRPNWLCYRLPPPKTYNSSVRPYDILKSNNVHMIIRITVTSNQIISF